MNTGSKFGEAISGIKLPANKPLVGDNVFSDQSELHFMAQAQRRFAFQGILPEEFGAHRSFLYGKLTSNRIIALTAQRAGVALDPALYPAIREALYQAAEGRKGWAIHEADFWDIVRPLIK